MAELEHVLWIALGGLIAAIAGYFGGYFGEKGKNYATKEDFDDLRLQQQELTRATKEIESKIEDEVWDRQRHWEMKKEALSDLLRAAADFEQALVEASNITPADVAPQTLPSARTPKISALVEAWRVASNNFERASLVASLVASKETREAILKLNSSLRAASSDLLAGGGKDAYGKHGLALVSNRETVVQLIREELGVPTTPQSNGFSEAPIPAH
jgi:hypothetical protein